MLAVIKYPLYSLNKEKGPDHKCFLVKDEHWIKSFYCGSVLDRHIFFTTVADNRQFLSPDLQPY
jgi:hypothetical protein